MKHLPVGLASFVIVAMAFASVHMPEPATASTAHVPVKFGMDSPSIASQTNAGVKPDYATFWIGPWTLSSGWAGPDRELDKMRAAGITPAIHFYYWGDDISRSCIENGCWSSLHNSHKNKAGWQQLAQQLVDHLNARMGGEPVVIFLESEFNKADVGAWEPLDGYLEEKAKFIRQHYPNVQIVMALGNWNSAGWSTYDRTAQASDFLGIQGLRGSTRQNLADYGTLYEGLQSGAEKLKSLFGKPIMIQDIALSSYPEPDWLKPQADTLQEVFTNLPKLKATGVQAIIYRSWQDSRGMSTANYYGEAERYWGLANSNAPKPSADVWIRGVKAERAGAAAPTSPTPSPSATTTPLRVPDSGLATEVDTFAVRTAGGRVSDGSASGGATWNLWSNGHVAQSFELPAGDHTITLRARGSLFQGEGPRMTVSWAGSSVLVAHPGTSYADHTVQVAGGRTAELRIAFDNDAMGGGEDRNLLLDRVTLAKTDANRAPQAQFVANVEHLRASLDASGSSDPDGDALSFRWSFGDGAEGTGATAQHTYTKAGTYAVVLTVHDGKASSTARRDVTVTQPNRAPVAAFVASVDGVRAALDARSSTDADGDALTYEWSLGDGTNLRGAQVEHRYQQGGSYLVTLTVSDGTASSSAQERLEIRVPPMTASFVTSNGINEWWVEVKVTSSNPAVRVEASVNGGGWVALSPTSWGTWAKSFYVARGSSVVYRATDEWQQSVSSAPVRWLEKPLAASFTPKAQANPWWVEVVVKSDAPLSKVEARVNGGAWTQLSPTSWGSWAKSVHAPRGSWVEFRATGNHGGTAISPAYPWGG